METPPPFENDRYASPPSEPEPKPTTQPRKWYRFTLWKMVVAFVLLGVVFAYLRYTHWGYVLSESITRAGRSMGMTSQRDPNKIYVSAVRPLESDDWEWSVQIPRSEIYSVCIGVDDIPVQVDKNELAKIGHVVLSWNYLVNVYAASDWDSAGGLDGISHVIHHYNGMMPSYDGSAWSGTGDLSWLNGSVQQIGIDPSDGVQVFEPGETIILMHQWPSDSDPPDEPGARHENGILIWLAPAPLGGPWDKYRLPKPTGSTPAQN